MKNSLSIAGLAAALLAAPVYNSVAQTTKLVTTQPAEQKRYVELHPDEFNGVYVPFEFASRSLTELQPEDKLRCELVSFGKMLALNEKSTRYYEQRIIREKEFNGKKVRTINFHQFSDDASEIKETLWKPLATQVLIKKVKLQKLPVPYTDCEQYNYFVAIELADQEDKTKQTLECLIKCTGDEEVKGEIKNLNISKERKQNLIEQESKRFAEKLAKRLNEESARAGNISIVFYTLADEVSYPNKDELTYFKRGVLQFHFVKSN